MSIAACDVSDREALEKLLASIPAEQPLGAVIHVAGAIDDGVLESQDPDRLRRALRPKANGAWHLHELTAELDLTQFLMFSSVMGVIGGAAQANYAAANVFLDALAATRQAQGLPATSLAWGGWLSEANMIGRLSDAARGRLLRLGFAPIEPDEGLELFDLARELPEPLLAPVSFDAAVLREQATAGSLSPMLRGLIRAKAGVEVDRVSLAERLADLPEAEREPVVLDLVRSHVAVVLGHSSGAEIEVDKAFQEMGFDSLAAVELRNRLSVDTGMALSPTLVFDYPSAAALAARLLADTGVGSGTEQERREAQIRELLLELETNLASLEPSDEVRERAGTRLRSLLVGLSASDSAEADEPEAELAEMSDEEMFELIDEEFGSQDETEKEAL